MVVRLKRASGTTAPEGIYQCTIDDAALTPQMVYVGPTRLSPEGLEHGELPGKLQQGHGVEVRRVRSWEATPLTLPVLLGATQT